MTVLACAERCWTGGTRPAAPCTLDMLTSVRWCPVAPPPPPDARRRLGAARAPAICAWRLASVAPCLGRALVACRQRLGQDDSLTRHVRCAVAAMTALLARVLRRRHATPASSAAAPDASSRTRAALEPGAAERTRILAPGLHERVVLRVQAGGCFDPSHLPRTSLAPPTCPSHRRPLAVAPCRLRRRRHAAFASGGLRASERPALLRLICWLGSTGAGAAGAGHAADAGGWRPGQWPACVQHAWQLLAPLLLPEWCRHFLGPLASA